MSQTDADFLIDDRGPVSLLAILDEIAVQAAHDLDLHITITVNHSEEINPDRGDGVALGVGTLTTFSPLAQHKIVSEALDDCKEDASEETDRIARFKAEIEKLENEMGGTVEEVLAEQREDAEAKGALTNMLEDVEQKALAEGIELADQLTKLLGLPLDPSNEDILAAIKELQVAAKGN
jgi:hypothetical protein